MSLREVDRAVIEGVVQAVSGECQFCHCHGDECRMGPGDTCGWFNELKTVCSYPKCVSQYHEKQKLFRKTTRRVSLFGNTKSKKKGKR